ncbi:MAG: hypothetical protein V4700_01240 [Pseudomonadota bacterium]
MIMNYIAKLLGISILGALLLSVSNLSIFASQNDAILNLLHITPSRESVDYVQNKKQFQLQNLLTEQRHPKTNNLSYLIGNDTQGGLKELLIVDKDISKKFIEMANNPQQLKILENASQAIEMTIINHRKIFFYGTGATGRLSVLVESSLWRPYWEKFKLLSEWQKIKQYLPDVENTIIGTITGGDRALLSSLPAFEDLQSIGRLQLQEQHIQKGDLVFAITEGGETSAVIGSVLSEDKLNSQAKQKNLYFIYNNPDKTLLPFVRSRSVLQNPNIIKINLTTGPQAIAGSTRMQATTSELYLMGILLEDALQHILKKYLSRQEMQQLGFSESTTLKQRLLSFQALQVSTYHMVSKIAPWIDLEAKTYATHHRAIYFANQALLPVFTDITERAPTFRLEPLDTINIKKSWVSVWTTAKDQEQAWLILLHHPFRGLNYNFYLKEFEKIQDPFLRTAALQGLKQAGNEQQFLYDLSFSKKNIAKVNPNADDLGVLVLFSGEQLTDSGFYDYFQLLTKLQADTVIIQMVTKKSLINKEQGVALQFTNKSRTLGCVDNCSRMSEKALFFEYRNGAYTAYVSNETQKNNAFSPSSCNCQHILYIPITVMDDPLGLNQQVMLKMLLNAHSSAVMAKLDRVVGNTMTNVDPSNLKLIGRATYLIQLQINAVLNSPVWLDQFGQEPPISYAEANAILFNIIDVVKTRHTAIKTSEVALSIIRILESLKQQRPISWEQAEEILHRESLSDYLRPYFREVESLYATKIKNSPSWRGRNVSEAVAIQKK